MKTKSTDTIMKNKVFAWITLITIAILLIPLIAMQFTTQVNWTIFDFAVMGTLLLGTGFSFVYVARLVHSKYRLLIGLMFAAIFLWVWAELAVGVFTNLGS